MVSLGRSSRLFPTLDATNFKLRPCERGMTSERRVGTCHVLCLHVQTPVPNHLNLNLNYPLMYNMNCMELLDDHLYLLRYILQMNHK